MTSPVIRIHSSPIPENITSPEPGEPLVAPSDREATRITPLRDSVGTIRQVDLALSGGGFRATLFHLGVLACLRDNSNLLKRVRTICSVSGGSILAAHFVCHWDDYCSDSDEPFVRRVSQLVTSVMSQDVSSNVLKKSLARLIDFKPLDTERLADEYIDLLDLRKRSHRWDDLPAGRPDLYILATHLKTGRAGAFHREGFSILPVEKNHRHYTAIRAFGDFARGVSTKNQSVTRAVAASSAFPPAFSPLALEPDDATHTLTDGGVYDNSGVNYLRHLYENVLEGTSDHLVIVSDAGRDFPTELQGQYDTFMTLALRVTDAQGSRIAEMDSRDAAPFFKSRCRDALFLSIHDSVAPLAKGNDNHSEKVQQLLRTIRTELDCFSPEEVFVLYRHGYRVAHRILNERGLAAGTGADAPWLPPESDDRNLRAWTKGDIEARLAESHEFKKEVRGLLWGLALRKVLKDYPLRFAAACLLITGVLMATGYAAYRAGAPQTVRAVMPAGTLAIRSVDPIINDPIMRVPSVTALVTEGIGYVLRTAPIGELTNSQPSLPALVRIQRQQALVGMLHLFLEQRSDPNSLLALPRSGTALALPAGDPDGRLVGILVSPTEADDPLGFVTKNLILTVEQP